MFLSFVPSRDAEEHLRNSLEAIADLEQVLREEGRERVEVVGLRARVEYLMAQLVEVEEQTVETEGPSLEEGENAG